MKRFLLFFCSLAYLTTVQAQYTGGIGDGYASATLENVWIGVENSNDLLIATNPWESQQSLQLLIPYTDKETTVTLVLYNALGQLVYNQESIPITNPQLPPLYLPPALYILEIQGWKKESVFERLIVQ